jgi:hypothetical protein
VSKQATRNELALVCFEVSAAEIVVAIWPVPLTWRAFGRGLQLAQTLLPRSQTKLGLENQNSVLFFGIPVVYFAISYMPFFEERL